jgi:hypothetical protein
MLENTLSTNFVPGTNLTGGLARASWRFLLPSLELDNVLCLGVPAAATLNVLATISENILVVSTNARDLETTYGELEPQVKAKVRTAHITDFCQLPLADKSVSLVFFAGKKELAGMLRDAALPATLDRLLKDGGAIYLEIKNLSDRRAARRMIKKLTSFGFNAPRAFWLTPLRGELRTAFPLDDDRMAKYLFTNVLFGQSLKMRALSSAGVWLSQTHLLRSITPRRAILLQRSLRHDKVQPSPEYLVSIAEKSGVDLSGLQCGLSARGKFNANKNIFYLFDRDGKKAKAVIKMTRAAEFNSRLENEYRVLFTLQEKGFVDPATYPEPLFFGYHAQLAILGQKAVHGEPFRSRTKATVDCPIAHDAINWIVKLGTASSNPSAATAAQVGEALMQLFRRFTEIYPLAKFEADFLATQITAISDFSGKFPLVFQHGDPGTWNMLVSAAGRVIVIDWEAGEPEGMPLWDLFYFMRTYGSWVSRVQGNKNPLENFTRNFLEPSALHALLAETTRRYCAGAGLAADLIAPLFYTCWMHRSLKEATRLPKDSLQKGVFFNLLRRCIERRNSPALVALFSLNVKGKSEEKSVERNTYEQNVHTLVSR